jgi:alpha-beta hydrolase superfamily lysophospholipase
VRAYEEDPLVHGGSIPARTLAELLVRVGTFRDRAATLRLPVLIMYGTADSLVRLADAQPVYERIGSADKTVKLYAGLFHEIFNEPERAQVFADLEAWLRARLPLTAR